MKKTTKGALAAGSATVLLMGGAGTLAYWSDAAAVEGTEIATGHLKLINPSCDGTGDWTLDEGLASEAVYSGQLLVPGDTLSRTCTFEVDAVGDHLEAELEVTEGTGFTGDPALLAEIDTSDSIIEVDGTEYAGVPVEVVDGDIVTVTFVADWGFGVVDNDSNVSGGLGAVLDSVGVTITQVDSH